VRFELEVGDYYGLVPTGPQVTIVRICAGKISGFHGRVGDRRWGIRYCDVYHVSLSKNAIDATVASKKAGPQ
jgi:hypothetical protein